LFVTSRNSDLNSGALETAEQSKGMQGYHEFSLKSALKLLILGWVVVYDFRPEKINECDPVTRIMPTLVWFSYFITFTLYGVGFNALL
jgi:hypothetical protein